MPRVMVPAPFQGPTQGQGEIKVQGQTVRECLEAVETEYKGFLVQVVRPDGKAQRFVKIFVNEEQVGEGDLDTEVDTDDEIQILAAIGGG